VREVEVVTARPGAQGSEVDRDASQREALNVGAASTKHRVNPREQLLEIERLGDIIVGAKLQAANPIIFLASCGQHHNWRAPALAQETAQLESVLAREHHVQDDEIGRELSRLCDGKVAIIDSLDLESFNDEIVGKHGREA
jgi:hypothetical protein